MADTPTQATCQSCGAPDDGDAVFCRFCKQAYNAQLLASAIPCPRCKTACRWGKQKCSACQSWIVVACVFCGAISPHNQSTCMRCGEGFQGAPERKAQREAQHQAQQNMQAVSVFGNIGGAFLGAMAGSTVAHAWHDSSYSTYDYDESDPPPSGGGSSFESSGDDGSAFESGGDDGGGFDFGGD